MNNLNNNNQINLEKKSEIDNLINDRFNEYIAKLQKRCKNNLALSSELSNCIASLLNTYTMTYGLNKLIEKLKTYRDSLNILA